ncbi:MAG: hypothetical protein HYY50_01135 [Candidatus Kerfeldbacteria bacterium]|nr:hypothetical protein [Candidatus Kerfeldbacteria bacterium]
MDTPTSNANQATKEDMAGLTADIRELKALVQDEGATTRESVFDLHSAVDRYLKRTEDWHQEFAVLKARHDRLAEVLMSKRVVSDEDLKLV